MRYTLFKLMLPESSTRPKSKHHLQKAAIQAGFVHRVWRRAAEALGMRRTNEDEPVPATQSSASA